MSKKKNPPYRTSLRIYKKATLEALSSYGTELNIKQNALVNKIIEEHLERYYTSNTPSFDDLKSVFFSFYSEFKIKTENLRNTNVRFLKIFLHQYLSELWFMDLFFNKLEINYYHYYKSNITQVQDQTLAYQDFVNNFIEEWYYELRARNVINSLTDISDFNFNYKNLEIFINDKLCNNRVKLKVSNFDEHTFFKNEFKRVNTIKGVESAEFGNINLKNEILKQFNTFMKNESDLEDVSEIEFKPYIVFRILNLDDFIKFLIESFLAESFYNNFTEIFVMQNFMFKINNLSVKKLIKSYNTPLEIMKIYEEITERIQRDKNIEDLHGLKTYYKLFKLSLELTSFNLYTRILTKQFEKMKNFESNLDSFFGFL